MKNGSLVGYAAEMPKSGALLHVGETASLQTAERKKEPRTVSRKSFA